MKTEMIRARVEPKLKADAEQVLAELGISATDAITIFYRQIVLRRGLPFDVLLPNAKTRKALQASDKRLLSAQDADDFFDQLGVTNGKNRSHHVETARSETVREGFQATEETRQEPGNAGRSDTKTH